MCGLTGQIVQQVGQNFVSPVDLAEQGHDIRREWIALQSEDLQLEEFTHLQRKGPDVVVVQQELTKSHQLPNLRWQVTKLVARKIQLDQACEAADLWWDSSQVVVVQVERRQMLQLPQVGTEVSYST